MAESEKNDRKKNRSKSERLFKDKLLFSVLALCGS